MTWIYVLIIITILISGSIILLFRQDNAQILKLLLAFSGAFLIGITFLNLVPQVYKEPVPFTGLFILFGFILQILLEILTKGIEHGHEHDRDHCRKEEHISPYLLMTGLCIHSFLEGMPVVPSLTSDIKTTLVTGIIIHNIPISLALMNLFIHYGMKRATAFLMLLLFALMTPFGSILSRILQETTLRDVSHYFIYAMAVVIGIFLHVSTSILFETEENHQYNLRKFITILLGLIIAIGVSFLSHSH